MNIATTFKLFPRLIIALISLFSLVTVVLGTSAASAANPCGDVQTTIIKCNTDGGNPVTSILIQVINFMAVGVGIAVVGGIVWGGMIYASSNGDAAKVKEAKNIIVNAVIGLLLFFFMYAIINYIVPGGVFS